MAISTAEKAEDYILYAQHCLKSVGRMPDQNSRMVQREMAAEWLRLAQGMATDAVCAKRPSRRRGKAASTARA